LTVRAAWLGARSRTLALVYSGEEVRCLPYSMSWLMRFGRCLWTTYATARLSAAAVSGLVVGCTVVGVHLLQEAIAYSCAAHVCC